MTERTNNTAKARAEAAFRKVTEPAPAVNDSETETTGPADEPASKSRPVETAEGAMDEYLARREAERAKTTRLRELRLAVEAKAKVKPTVKGKPGGTGKWT